MPCPPEIVSLVERFRDNEDVYRSGRYNETQLRRELIDPFFEALGWDMNNRRGYAEPYKDVIHEDSIKLAGGATKAPDYCFRIGGVRKFFLEAKNPSVSIAADPAPAFQLRRYAWSSKLPLSILTNFAEFSVYDCRFRPAPSDGASKARILHFAYLSYVERWDELVGLFSPDSVQRGAFDRFADPKRARRGTEEVDAAFLGDLEHWREVLARNIASHNRLTPRQLNVAVQMTIDRVVFLRICEDRGIEPVDRLRGVADGDGIYRRLCDVFEDADDRYNSGLFHFKRDKDRAEPPDRITPSLRIDDKPLREMLHGLYPPASPYEFSVLPAEILGQVYEQFLGRVVTITKSGRVDVDLRPEVRKAGGVYYTPGYIVSYIVDQTVRPLLGRLDPRSAAKIRILDPSCGSGSFLIGAYELLLQWHLDWYRAKGAAAFATGRQPALRRDKTGEWRLTTVERKRILLNSIFGVDIDAQAVEVTKLSLLLKVLEGENHDTLASQLRLFRERALPDLGANIRCGNALIDVDVYADLLGEVAPREGVDADENHPDELNAFPWTKGFPFLQKTKGFDAIIGNPPWGADLSDPELAYLRERHSRVVSRMIDTYIYFFDKSLALARNEDAPVGLIVPATILNQVDAAPLRRLLLKRGVTVALNCGRGIFGSNVLNTSAIIVSRSQPNDGQLLAADLAQLDIPARREALSTTAPRPWRKWAASVAADPHATFFVGEERAADLLTKARRTGRQLVDVLAAAIERGVTPDVVEAHIFSRKSVKAKKIEPALLRKSVSGTQVRRYNAWHSDQLLLYTHRDLRIQSYPKAYEHLREFRSQITCKEVKAGKHPWWALHRARKPEIFGSPKFVGLTTTPRVEVIYDERDNLCVTDAMYVFRPKEGIDPWGLMALMHSRVFLFLYQVSNQGEGRVIPQIKAAKLQTLPFPPADRWSREVDGLAHGCRDRLDLAARVAADESNERLANQIAGVEEHIERIVAAMYDLDDDDLRVIDSSSSAPSA